MSRKSWIRWLLFMAVLALVWPQAVSADDTLASQADAFMMPWPTGASYPITWGPDDHWLSNPRLGFAVDIGLPSGTPLTAPAAGEANYLVDTRPYQYGLGNYIDLVCGNWKIRLAHLLEERTETRHVEAGEFLGFSGSSGASAAHLHIELFVYDGGGWRAAQYSDLHSFMGIPLSELVEGMIVTNAQFSNQVVWSKEPAILNPEVSFAQPLTISIPLRNNGIEPIQVTRLQVLASDPVGNPYVFDLDGDWQLAAQNDLLIEAPYLPTMPGWWHITQVSVINSTNLWRLPTDLSFIVANPGIEVIGITGDSFAQVGEQPEFEVWLANHTDTNQFLDHISLFGSRPDHSSWNSVTTESIYIPAHQVVCLYLNTAVLSQSGEWRLTRITFESARNTMTLGVLEHSIVVDGPQLVIKNVGVRQNGRIYLTLLNIGTAVADTDWFEVLVLDTANGSVHSVVARQVPQLAPDDSATIVLPLPPNSLLSDLKLVSAGYWLNGQYYPVKLEQYTVLD
ncbi:MAG: M23 family metallopeptidase [Anaerolineae bacterium]